MGFFEKLIRIFTGGQEDARMRKVREQINELDLLKRMLDKKLSALQSTVIAERTSFSLSKKESQNITISTFSPRNLGLHTTMADLLERRLEEERQRIRLLRIEVQRILTLAKDLLREDDIEGAEDALSQASPLVRDINDENLSTILNESFTDLADLKARMRLREIERQRNDAIRLAQEERQREENLRLQRELEEQIRIERERQAREFEEQLALEEQIIREEKERLTTIVRRPKVNPQAYINHLRLNHVQCFYHFTDELNLNSIRRYGGLFSWYYCERHGIHINNAGGDVRSRNLDRRYNLEDYVKLSFCSDHPMAYRKHQEGAKLVLLKIKIDVAAFMETTFSDMNATDSAHTHGNNLEDLQRVNIAATQARCVRRDHPYFSAHQAECMVKTFVPIEFIENIDNPERMLF